MKDTKYNKHENYTVYNFILTYFLKVVFECTCMYVYLEIH